MSTWLSPELATPVELFWVQARVSGMVVNGLARRSGCGRQGGERSERAAAAGVDQLLELLFEPAGHVGVLVDDVVLFARILRQVKQLELWDPRVDESQFDVASLLGIVPLQLPLAGAEAVVTASPVVLLDKMRPSWRVGLAQESSEHIEAVDTGVGS